MDEGEEARSKLVKAHGDTAELLELEEEGLHKVAFLVQPPIDRPGVGDIRRWRDTVIGAVGGDILAKLALGVGSVARMVDPLKSIWLISFWATVMSAVLPVVSMIAMGLPKASTAA